MSSDNSGNFLKITPAIDGKTQEIEKDVGHTGPQNPVTISARAISMLFKMAQEGKIDAELSLELFPPANLDCESFKKYTPVGTAPRNDGKMTDD